MQTVKGVNLQAKEKKRNSIIWGFRIIKREFKRLGKPQHPVAFMNLNYIFVAIMMGWL